MVTIETATMTAPMMYPGRPCCLLFSLELPVCNCFGPSKQNNKKYIDLVGLK
jgi:hypothetical protein